MRIISPWKDYYDYVAHAYGGGDPSIVYVRGRLTSGTEDFELVQNFSVEQAGIVRLPNLTYMHSVNQAKWLVVCGKYYLLVRSVYTQNDWQILNKDLHSKIWEFLIENNKRYFSYYGSLRQDDYLGKSSPSLIELSKKVGAPVFTISSTNHDKIVYVDKLVPNLEKLDFHNFYSPEQLYQELSYFIVNTMKDSPDMMPPTAMTDKEKITQHGFDLKQSFRHRK